MNAETLKRLEELNEKWANEHLETSAEFNDLMSEVMDHLPDLIAAVKERGAFAANMDYSVRLGIATATEQLQKERDGALANLKMKEERCEEWKRTAEALKESMPAANRLCRELEQVKQERDSAQKAAAGLRHLAYEVKRVLAYVAYQRLPLGNTVMDTLPEHWQKEVNTALDIITDDCGNGYHHEREIEPLVEALKRIYNFPVHSEPVGGAYNMQDIAHAALAQWEKENP